jgi:hypothetical protein
MHFTNENVRICTASVSLTMIVHNKIKNSLSHYYPFQFFSGFSLFTNITMEPMCDLTNVAILKTNLLKGNDHVIDTSLVSMENISVFLVQSFKETLQYCDEGRKFTSISLRKRFSHS